MGQVGPSNSRRDDCCNGHGNNLIEKYSFEEKMKEGPISKLTITETGHRPTQLKKITDALPVLCADKNFRGLNEVLWTGRDLGVKTDFMPTYPNATQWSTTHHVQVSTVNPFDVPAADGSRPVHFEIMEQTHIFDGSFQKELLLEYERDSKNKSQEYTKFLADKKALITILSGQCDEATRTKIALGATYTADHQAGRLIAFIKQMCTVFLVVTMVAYHMGPINKL